MKTFLKTYDLFLLFLKKKLFFVLSMAHENPIFAQVGPKNFEVLAFFFWTAWFQLKLLILTESANIYVIGKQQKKSKWVWFWGKI